VKNIRRRKKKVRCPTESSNRYYHANWRRRPEHGLLRFSEKHVEDCNQITVPSSEKKQNAFDSEVTAPLPKKNHNVETIPWLDCVIARWLRVVE